MSIDGFAESIFAELDKFGLSAVAEKKQEVFKLDPKTQKTEQQKEVHKFNIDDFVYTKNFTCPVCGQNFMANVVRESKIRVDSIEFDLRPICSPIDPMLYIVVVCESCGYSAVNKAFNKITGRQSEIILSEISPNFKPIPYPKEPTVEMAIERYKLALLNALVKNAKDGEKAYICMKITWLYRIKGNELPNEKKFADLTVKGFTNALAKEFPPIMSLEESTILCLLGAFLMFLGDNESALRILSDLIVSKKSSERLKDRARDLKNEIIAAKLLANKNGPEP